jgi:hypothetical protein
MVWKLKLQDTMMLNQKLDCKICLLNNVIACDCCEDEIHVLFNCSPYNDVRSLYVSSESSSLYDFVKWMKIDNHYNIVNLANFVYSIYNIRKQLLDVI